MLLLSVLNKVNNNRILNSYFLILIINHLTFIVAGNEEYVGVVGIPWISNIISKAMVDYFPYGKESTSLCTHQGHLMRIFSNNYTTWALRMLDSSSKGPSGVIYGNSYDFGHFDECISTTALNNTLKGQFMMVSLLLLPSNKSTQQISFSSSDYSQFLEQDSSYWNLLEVSTSSTRRVKGRNRFSWALCVPNSCSNNDIKYSVNRTLMSILDSYGLRGNISVLEEFTYSRSEKRWNTGAITFGTIVLTILCMVLMGTVFQVIHFYKKRNHGKLVRKFRYCSLLYNLSKLNENQGSISVISGLKVISIIIIIYGHRMMITMFSPIKNTYDNEIVIGKLLNTYYLNGILIVDTFLVITGFLSFNKMLKSTEKLGQINLLRFILRRYMRFTPTYAFILGYTIWISPYLEEGPLASNVIWDTKDCSWVWWTHLLYMNNYIHSKHQCIVPSWYLAADMQLYIFCSIIAYLIGKFKRSIGVALLITSSLLSIIVPAVIIILKGYKGATFLYLSDFASFTKNSEFIETYFQTHFRSSPYIVGMMAAWAYRKIEASNKKQFKINHKNFMTVVTLVQLISMNVSILSAWWFYRPGKRYSVMELMFYSFLHRLGWALPLSWIIVLHSSNLFAPFQKILSFSGFGPLNQLSYSVFLVHTPLQLYLAGQNRDPVYYNWLTSWWMAAADAIFSYGAALILFLIVEAPFSKLFIL